LRNKSMITVFLLISLLFIHGNLIADADTLELHSINAATSDTNCMFNEAWTGESGCPDGCGVAYGDTIGCDWSSMQTMYLGHDIDHIWQCGMWALLWESLEDLVTQGHKIDSIGFYHILRKFVIGCAEDHDTTYCNENAPEWDSAKDYNTFYAIPPVKISEEYFTFGEGDEASTCPDTGDATYRFRRWPDHPWLLSEIGYGDICATRILIDSAGIDRSDFELDSICYSRDDFTTMPWGAEYGDTARVKLRGDIATDAMRHSYDYAFYQHKDSVGPANCKHYEEGWEINSRSPAYTYQEPYIIVWHSAENDSIPPDTVENVIATQKWINSIALSWDAVAGASGYVLQYINAADSLGPYVFWAGLRADSVGTTSVTVTGLSENEYYTIAVFAVDAAGNYSVRGSNSYYYGQAVDSSVGSSVDTLQHADSLYDCMLHNSRTSCCGIDPENRTEYCGKVNLGYADWYAVGKVSGTIPVYTSLIGLHLGGRDTTGLDSVIYLAYCHSQDEADSTLVLFANPLIPAIVTNTDTLQWRYGHYYATHCEVDINDSSPTYSYRVRDAADAVGVTWGTQGAVKGGVDIDLDISDSITINGTGWKRIPITNCVRAAMDSGNTYCDMVFRDINTYYSLSPFHVAWAKPGGYMAFRPIDYYDADYRSMVIFYYADEETEIINRVHSHEGAGIVHSINGCSKHHGP